MRPLGKAQRETLQALAGGGFIIGMSRYLYEPAPPPLNYRRGGKVPLSIIDALYDRGYIRIGEDKYVITDEGRAAIG